jgi:hypothetical protein
MSLLIGIKSEIQTRLREKIFTPILFSIIENYKYNFDIYTKTSTMKNINLVTLLVLISTVVSSQSIRLTDYLLYPRQDSSYWEKDYDALNSIYSKNANRCQTCVFTETDSTRGRFCFNTTLGHVQMDTALHNITPQQLMGKWDVISFGLFEICDSILTDFKVHFRNEKILDEPKNARGHISFTDKRIKIELKNIKGIPNVNKRYKIFNGRFLTTKTISGYCGATIIGIPQDGFLIFDDHTLRTKAEKGKYMVVSTSIRRIILKKNTTD